MIKVIIKRFQIHTQLNKRLLRFGLGLNVTALVVAFTSLIETCRVSWVGPGSSEILAPCRRLAPIPIRVESTVACRRPVATQPRRRRRPHGSGSISGPVGPAGVPNVIERAPPCRPRGARRFPPHCPPFHPKERSRRTPNLFCLLPPSPLHPLLCLFRPPPSAFPGGFRPTPPPSRTAPFFAISPALPLSRRARWRMDAIRKQATKLREQVAKQQQAVLKQFGGGGYGGSDGLITDEAELQQHQKLEKLYISTRAGKHFQRDIVRGVEGFIVTGSKQVEIGAKLSEDSRKYGVENTCTSGSTLSKAALCFGRAHAQMEKERGNLLKALGTQVAEPLRAMVMGAPLEDARHLAQRYDRMRQEAEAQSIEVSKRQMKAREASGNVDNTSKLEAAEAKLQELKSNMGILGKEAAAAMAAVEAQQQRLTLQRLIAMVESERTYHQRILQILDQLEAEMVSERQRIEASPSPAVDNHMPPPPPYEEVNGMPPSQTFDSSSDSSGYFLGEAMQSYQAESDVELNLAVGDVVVVRKISNNGWAEGECKGKAGWFPFAYVEKRERVLASKIAEVF
ncbi:hypothetical protein Taro_052472 [Colocasia esculenta]|uniref:SH3 domain-containing protein n=1 Tax=Colocasia esculenta TaxID=4460 RepID=A0A843XJG3_COLES|nr:hypothetical protein [Colocasia esculenta]